MAYNTTTERLLNAIKNNTASISIGDVNAIDAETKTAIIDTELSNDVIVTNTTNINNSVQALQGDNALNPGTSVTLEDLRLLLNTIDADTSNIDTSLNNIETNSDQSLGKGGSLIVTGATDVIGSAGNAISTDFNTAVQFLEETTITNYQVGSSAEQTSLSVVIPAGTIIYGDIRILVISVAKNCILYKA